MRVTQAYTSANVRHFKKLWFAKYNFVPLLYKHKPSVIIGLYTTSDYKVYERHQAPMIVVWCGGDSRKLNQQKVDIIKSKDAKHIARGKYIHDNLSKWGIESIEMPLNPQTFDITYHKKGKYIYHYGVRGNFYGEHMLPEISKRTGLKIIKTNSHTYTREKLIEVYKQCFIALRLTKSDGLPNTVLEMGLMGRKSIYNGGLPYSIAWKGVDDICESILQEYANREEDYSYISQDYKDFLKVDNNWLEI